MKIEVVAISKPERDCYSQLCDRFKKISSRYASIEIVELFNSKVTKAQEAGAEHSKKIYSQLFEPWMSGGYRVALDPSGKSLDSHSFARLLQDRARVSFFIGGAYGHSDKFLKECDAVISLSPLTMSHKVAKVVICEQIYRALTILNNHPYHK
ncbi:MAG: 23S rRNA (pseudouridine(1915)-N(3))-methyltransferase RlmH [Hydrogenimonas sp.]|nr:23S rRNA (pseudouridine(1915)-N(3))-methyltransferase RlmH [Hydrogenimonas sp.]